jgi:hypothetical protein
MRRGGDPRQRRSVSAEYDPEGGNAAAVLYHSQTSFGSSLLNMESSPMSLISSSSNSSLDSQAKERRRTKHRHFTLDAATHWCTSRDPHALGALAMGILVATLVLTCIIPIFTNNNNTQLWSIFSLVFGACTFGVVASAWLAQAVLSCDDGSAEMRAVSDPIRQGAEGFLRVQYAAIAKVAVPLAVMIVASYQFRPSPANDKHVRGAAQLGNTILGIVAALGFVFGALASALSGYVSMWVAAQSNVRVASAARRSYGEALVICFRGGAFSAVLNLTLCILGVTSLYTILCFLFTGTGQLKSTEIPMLLVGYGFGASFVALFMQLGGGIYTKAADVGADLVGKVEQSIPEDDPRNRKLQLYFWVFCMGLAIQRLAGVSRFVYLSLQLQRLPT